MSQIKDDIKFFIQVFGWGLVLIVIGYGIYYWLSNVVAAITS